MKLSGQQRKELCSALLSAFPQEADLEQFMSFELDVALYEVAGGATHSQVTFKLVCWAESEGQLKDLMQAAGVVA